jgi:hypothetical protein
VLLSRHRVMYTVERKVISGRVAFHSLLMQVVSMMVSAETTDMDTRVRLAGFCTRVLHLGMSFVRDLLDLFSKVIHPCPSHHAVLCALMKSHPMGSVVSRCTLQRFV